MTWFILSSRILVFSSVWLRRVSEGNDASKDLMYIYVSVYHAFVGNHSHTDIISSDSFSPPISRSSSNASRCECSGKRNWDPHNVVLLLNIAVFSLRGEQQHQLKYPHYITTENYSFSISIKCNCSLQEIWLCLFVICTDGVWETGISIPIHRNGPLIASLSLHWNAEAWRGWPGMQTVPRKKIY